MMRRAILVPLYLFVFATGASGLIYQVAWQKYLSRLLGSDSIATAVILATFLGGLSLGYLLCGKLTTRVSNHFKAYAALEGLIGAWGLLFPTLFGLVGAATRGWSFSPPVLIILQGMLCSSLLLVLPTLCMGGTIPFLTRGVSSNITEATRVHATVYAVNTAGAFIGTLAAGFFLVPALGLPLTVMGAAFLNLSAALFFYLLSVSMKKPSPGAGAATGQDAAAQTAQPSLFPAWSLAAVAFLSGFYVMTLENVLIRITNLSLGSSSYSFTMIVSVFVLAIAVGSFIVGRMEALSRPALFYNQALIAILLLVVYLTLDTWPYWAHVIRICFQSNMAGFWAFHAAVFLVLTTVFIVPVALMGATVPIAFHEIKRDLATVGRHSGLLFSWNTVGSLTGSLVGGIVFYYLLNNGGVFLAATLLATASACVAARYVSRWHLAASGTLAAAILLLVILNPLYNERNFMFGTFIAKTKLPYSFGGPGQFFGQFTKGMALKFYEDGPEASVAVLESARKGGNALSIIVNGKSDSSTVIDAQTLRLTAHIPALLAKKHDSALVIGLGTGVTAGELSLYPDLKRIDIAEISPTVVKTLPLFARATHDVQKDPRVRIHVGDAFRVLGRSQERWDIIVSEPSNPWVTGVDLLFTREFYAMVKEHLTDGGVLMQWANLYFADFAIVGMILNTIRQEFPQSHAFVDSNADLLIVATKRELTPDDLRSAQKMLEGNPAVRASLSEIGFESLDAILLREVWTPSFISSFFSGYGIQTMDNPRLHYMAGKLFYTGEGMSEKDLFSAEAASSASEFLLAMKLGAWESPHLPDAAMKGLLPLTQSGRDAMLKPIASSLMLKAFLSNPAVFSLEPREAEFFDIYLLPLIMGTGDDGGWKAAGLEGASTREKALTMLEHIARWRTWIVPYPLDGAKAVMKEGLAAARGPYEKNWYALQLAYLLMLEGAGDKEIKGALGTMARGTDGEVLLGPGERVQLKAILLKLNAPAL